MTRTQEWLSEDGKLLFAADAFLLCAGIDMFIIALLVWLTSFLPEQYAIAGQAPAPQWMELLSAIVMGAVLIGGPLLVWRFRGGRFSLRALAGMLVGAALGPAIVLPVFAGLGALVQRLFGAGPNDPPWFAFGVLGVAAAAFAALPVIEAVRDLRRHPPRARALDWLRVASVVSLIALGGVVFPLIGAAQDGEAAEAGVFAVLFGAAAAFAVTGANLLTREPTAQESEVPASERVE